MRKEQAVMKIFGLEHESSLKNFPTLTMNQCHQAMDAYSASIKETFHRAVDEWAQKEKGFLEQIDELKKQLEQASGDAEFHNNESEHNQSLYTEMAEALKKTLAVIELWGSGKAMSINPWAQTNEAKETAATLLQKYEKELEENNISTHRTEEDT